MNVNQQTNPNEKDKPNKKTQRRKRRTLRVKSGLKAGFWNTKHGLCGLARRLVIRRVRRMMSRTKRLGRSSRCPPLAGGSFTLFPYATARMRARCPPLVGEEFHVVSLSVVRAVGAG